VGPRAAPVFAPFGYPSNRVYPPGPARALTRAPRSPIGEVDELDRCIGGGWVDAQEASAAVRPVLPAAAAAAVFGSSMDPFD
jgi:hypothetical protein